MRTLIEIADELSGIAHRRDDEVCAQGAAVRLRGLSVELISYANKLDMPETVKIFSKKSILDDERGFD